MSQKGIDLSNIRARDINISGVSIASALVGSGEPDRVHYMTGDSDDHYVPRPEEYERAKAALLAGGRTVALTTALHGAGGYGKTTLANALCRDPDIQREFTGGILRVELSKEIVDVTGKILSLVDLIDPQPRRPVVTDVSMAAELLASAIGHARILLMIDDVWRPAQLRPFLRAGPKCVRLVTTRMPQVLPKDHVPIIVDQMAMDQALGILSSGLPNPMSPGVRLRLAALAERLGFWAQMLAIANGWITTRVRKRAAPEAAVHEFEARLIRRGLTGFDAANENQRTRAIGICVEASLEELDPKTERPRLNELAVLPEDTGVPIAVVTSYWAASSGMDGDDADDLLSRLDDLSLLQSLDRGMGSVRLHDNMLWYLRDQIAPAALRAAHAAMVKAAHMACNGDFTALPADAVYYWRHLIRHMREAGQSNEANRLLTDYGWIKAKLHAVGPRGLFESYVPEMANQECRLIGRAIGLSLPALTMNARELPRQIFGRLGGILQPAAITLVREAQRDRDIQPQPCSPNLTPPGAELLRLVGHQEAVNSVAFAPDGARIVTASRDGTARVWDTKSSAEIALLRGHKYPVSGASFAPDGASIVTSSDDGTARLWDARTGAVIAVLRGHKKSVSGAAFSPDGARVVTSSHDGTARLWEAKSGEEIVVLHRHEDWVNSAAFSPDGARIVTTSDDRTARIWDSASGAEQIVLRGHDDRVSGAEFSPDGARVLTSSSDHTARLWDARNGVDTGLLFRHETPPGSGSFSERPLGSASFSPDGSRVVTTSGGTTVRLWNAADGSELSVLRGHENSVTGAVFSPDGARIATSSDDRTARLWDTESNSEIDPRRGHEGQVTGAAFCPGGARIITGSEDGTARLWDATSGAEIAVLRGHEGSVNSVAFSPDGALIATSSHDSFARLWDARTGAATATLRGHETWVNSAAFAPDSARIVTSSSDHTARIWDLRSGVTIAVLRGHERSATNASFSPDGKRVVTGGWDGTARLWDAFSGAEIAVLRGHDRAVISVSFSPSGARIVTTSWDNTARLWDAAGGETIAVLRGHENVLQRSSNQMSSAAFSPDGTCLVTTAWDNTARLWDAMNGTELAVLRGHEHRVSGAAFSPDGGRIITASSDRTARLWDSKTRAEPGCLALDNAVTALAIHGPFVALGDALGRVHIFHAR